MPGRLAGKRILVVEDEYFIASDLRRALDAEQAVVVGPVSSLAAGLELAEREGIAAALLDVNLEGDSSLAIADRLAARGIRFVFVTGYDAWALPDAYRHVPRIAKPFAVSTVLAALDQLLAPEDVP
ncbi:response regulator [Sphingomonas yunnanensis]|uniref:response regulator n=1 Tax=Sphingomonas yunnanensis TaxID=310400 RepID=UPI001CA7747A|nr:response regulator [Sphingomonas yunnanensis]MBY9063262.1 response regulator [Sphingomonas yunnanensis]